MRIPSVIHMASLDCDMFVNDDIGWIPARPLPYPSWKERWKLAWMVFTGKADVAYWPDEVAE